MSQRYQIGDRVFSVRIENDTDGWVRVAVSEPGVAGDQAAERVVRARYTPTQGTGAELELDGRRFRTHVAAGEEVHHVAIGGEVHAVLPPALLEKRRRGAGAAAGSGESARHVTPPMPGQVVVVLVAAGDVVAKGQAVVVIMAMKMETTLSAPHAGKVVNVNVAAGAQVKPGDILVDIEKEA